MMLTIAGIASAAAILNAIFPALNRSSGALIAASSQVDDRLKSDIEIIHAVGELDSAGAWDDTNSNGLFDIFMWVKNVGSTRILAIDQTDVFVGTTSTFTRIPHETEVEAGEYPRWTYTLENSTEWDSRATLKITVLYNATQSQGNYDVKIIIPNGVSDEHFFSM